MPFGGEVGWGGQQRHQPTRLNHRHQCLSAGRSVGGSLKDPEAGKRVARSPMPFGGEVGWGQGQSRQCHFRLGVTNAFRRGGRLGGSSLTAVSKRLATCHQCLSAGRSVGGHLRNGVNLANQSPMPFGGEVGWGGGGRAPTLHLTNRVTNAFRRGGRLGADIQPSQKEVKASPMPFGGEVGWGTTRATEPAPCKPVTNAFRRGGRLGETKHKQSPSTVTRSPMPFGGEVGWGRGYRSSRRASLSHQCLSAGRSVGGAAIRLRAPDAEMVVTNAFRRGGRLGGRSTTHA